MERGKPKSVPDSPPTVESWPSTSSHLLYPIHFSLHNPSDSSSHGFAPESTDVEIGVTNSSDPVRSGPTLAILGDPLFGLIIQGAFSLVGYNKSTGSLPDKELLLYLLVFVYVLGFLAAIGGKLLPSFKRGGIASKLGGITSKLQGIVMVTAALAFLLTMATILGDPLFGPIIQGAFSLVGYNKSTGSSPAKDLLFYVLVFFYVLGFLAALGGKFGFLAALGGKLLPSFKRGGIASKLGGITFILQGIVLVTTALAFLLTMALVVI